MSHPIEFVFVCCQVGAEAALKNDLARHHPGLRFAFSRPGFVTFKVSDPSTLDLEQPLRSVFARSHGASVGSIKGTEDRLAKSIALLPEQAYAHIHVWQRDQHVPGDRRFEPFHTVETLEIAKQLQAAAAEDSSLSKAAVNRTARQGELVADFVLVDPEHWFVGWHKAVGPATRWPGGIPPLRPNEHMVSRAYLKMQEALRWSRLPIQDGDICVELGSSPGGSCLALLQQGAKVIGIDPAKMHEDLMKHPNFTHIRARAADLKRKEFAEARWLVADANIAPTNSLDAIEDIVTNRRVNIRGMLLTLKLLDWKMAAEIENYLARIRGWGFRHVRSRQLAFNRREICVLAVRRKFELHQRRQRNESVSGDASLIESHEVKELADHNDGLVGDDLLVGLNQQTDDESQQSASSFPLSNPADTERVDSKDVESASLEEQANSEPSDSE